MGNMFKKVKKKEQGKVSLRWIMNNSGRLLVVCVVLGYTTKDLQFKWLHKATGGLGWKKGGKAENSLIVNRKLTCHQLFAKASFQFRGSICLKD